LEFKSKIVRIIYRKENEYGDNWYILKIEQGTAIGCCSKEPAENDYVILDGKWEQYKLDGSKQFKFTDCIFSLPDNSRELLALAVEMTKGFGEATENKIWDEFAENWLTCEISDVGGVSEKMAEEWTKTLLQIKLAKKMYRIIAWMKSKGLNSKVGVLAWGEWGENTVSEVESNPYILTQLKGVGFLSVDNVRGNFGIEDKEPYRLQAAIIYTMEQIRGKFGTLLDGMEIQKELEKIIPDVMDLVPQAIVCLEDEKRIVNLSENLFALMKDFENATMVYGYYKT